MHLSLISTALSLATLVLGSPILQSKRSNFVNFNYEADKVRGVNIGGWLVIEPYVFVFFFFFLYCFDVSISAHSLCAHTQTPSPLHSY